MVDGRKSQTAHKQTAVDAENWLIDLEDGYVRPEKGWKSRIARELGIKVGAFDLVRQIPGREHVDLIEVKGTTRVEAKTHFFSISENERDAAKQVETLGLRYFFVIVYGIGTDDPRVRSLTWDELWSKRLTCTMQYSIRIGE